MQDTNYLAISRNYGFLTKLKNFFKTIFYKDENPFGEYSANVANRNKVDQFTQAFGNRVASENSNSIYGIKKDLDEGKIKLSEISADQRKELVSLYKANIGEKKRKLENIQRRLQYVDNLVRRKMNV